MENIKLASLIFVTEVISLSIKGTDTHYIETNGLGIYQKYGFMSRTGDRGNSNLMNERKQEMGAKWDSKS